MSTASRARRSRWRDLAQELWELGPSEVAFRTRWELAIRSGWVARTERPPRPLEPAAAADALPSRTFFASPAAVRDVVAPRVDALALDALAARAEDAARGRVRCFGRSTVDFGDPIDWHLGPAFGARWDPRAHWSTTLADTGRVGDVKLTWELGRFPHAYELARAAAFGRIDRAAAASAVAAQIRGFVAANPYGRGVHWASGQEIVIRLVAWLFAASVLGDEPTLRPAVPDVVRHLHEGAVHVERHLDYARRSVRNNHLVSEAFGLLLAGAMLPEAPRARRWRELGEELLTEEASRQVYPDGGYLMHSNNYERAALQLYLLAAALQRARGLAAPPPWRAAMSRALDFLVAQQNPGDGRLPNAGSNDGALLAVLSTCDCSDFRPFLQALSIEARGERLYPPGPWDEEAAWLAGPAALEAPLREPRRRSSSFPWAGLHVLRGREPGSFCTFRCGTLRDRFAQIDMLHVDLWWRGENVLVDGGTYLYSGAERWLRHFTGAASHNTVTLDGRDQMVHFRRFKLIYLTRARVLRFLDAGDHAIAEGEHYGFCREVDGAVHRRSVLYVPDDLWIVVDRLAGARPMSARLHWLAGPYPHRHDAAASRLTLSTPAGPFSVAVLDGDARPVAGDVVSGSEDPPRGWLSRYYAEKVPVPSLAVVREAAPPIVLVSVLGAGEPHAQRSGQRWTVSGATRSVSFTLDDGLFHDVEVSALEAAP